MNITKDQIIAGYPATKIRDLFKKLATGNSFTHHFIGHVLRVSESEGHEMAVSLQELGLIGPDEYASERQSIPYYQTTVAGNALANASATRPFSRKTADKALHGFIERAGEVNAGDYAFKVGTAAVFGSYLGKKQAISDVDIAVELTPRTFDHKEFVLLREARINNAISSGRSLTFIGRLCWPRSEVHLLLKAGSRVIRLHEIDELVQMHHAEYKILIGDRGRITALRKDEEHPLNC